MEQDGTAQRDEERSATKTRRHVIVVAALAALGGLLFGYDTGVVSGALLFLRDDFGGLSTFQQELVTSLLLVGAAIGALASGAIADRIGRRLTIAGTAALFIAAVLLAAFTPSFVVLLVARVLIGLAVGSASTVVPLYIGEVAPPKIRGALVSLNQLAITLGIVTSFLVDYGLASTQNWRLMFGLAAIPALILLVGILFEKESPHWLAAHGREDEAREVLRTLRHGTSIDDEIDDVQKVTSQQQSASARELLSPRLRAGLVVGLGLAVFQQVTGINTVIYYAPSLLSNAGLADNAALLANVGIGVVNLALTFAAVLLLDRVGRRPLLLSGTAGMVVGMSVTAGAFLVGGGQLSGSTAIVAIIGLVLYTASFAIGLGPVFWLLISEIYPLRIRGRAMSVATVANWATNFLVTISFLSLVEAIGEFGVFAIFAALTLAAFVFFWFKVPETKGRSLQEIERQLTTT